jgi:hypothetical protein
VLVEELQEAAEVLPEEEELLVVHLEAGEGLVEVGLAGELLEEAVEVAASPAAEALPEEVASAHEGEGEGATKRLRIDVLYQRHLHGVQVVLQWRQPGSKERYQRMGGVLGDMFRDSQSSEL